MKADGFREKGAILRLVFFLVTVAPASVFAVQGSCVEEVSTANAPPSGSRTDGLVVGTRLPSANKTIELDPHTAELDADGDGLPDVWESSFGLDCTPASGATGQSGTYGDPDNDGIPNIIEYLICTVETNAFLSSPIDCDSDGDGMDDGYEYHAIGRPGVTNCPAWGASNSTAVVTPSGVYGPDGNPDGDTLWNTSTGYQATNPLMNLDEYYGPDFTPPGDFENGIIVAGISRPVRQFQKNPFDTQDASSSAATDTDGDGFDDGFEYSWDYWQSLHFGDPVGDPGGHRVPLRFGSLANRRFNPALAHGAALGDDQPDFDLLYGFNSWRPTTNWFSDTLECHAWQDNTFNEGISGAPHSIRRDEYPNTPRCTNPFLYDTDGDGLPDGYEVVFGLNPWSMTDQSNMVNNTVYVDDDAPNDPYPNDSSRSDAAEHGTPLHPYDSIQEAIVVAGSSGLVTVLVQDGTYSGTGNCAISTLGKAICLRTQKGSGATTIDTLGTAPAFIFGQSETRNTVVSGFTIRSSVATATWPGITLGAASPTFSNCLLTGFGGYGVVCSNGAAPCLNDCTIQCNTGGVSCSGSSPALVRCNISSNTTISAGGVRSASSSSPTLVNCLLAANSARVAGGAIYITSGSSLTGINCTVAGNLAGLGGGVYSAGSLQLRNCIIWSNSAPTGSGIATNAGTVDVQYSDVQGGWPGPNINTNPQFLPGAGQRLQFGSPCIDTGTATLAPTDDLTAAARPVDGDFNGNSAVDMGCYEYNPQFTVSGGDGIPDLWKHQHGFCPSNFVANLDSDSDGMNNGQEYTADTDPTNCNSLLRMTGLIIQSGQVRAQWTGGILVTQFLEAGYSLNATGLIWKTVSTNRPPTTASASAIDLSATNHLLFYRIRGVR